MNLITGWLAAFMGMGLDERKPAAQRGKVFVKPHSSNIFHIISRLAPRGRAVEQIQRCSFYQQYKPLNAPRHIAHR